LKILLVIDSLSSGGAQRQLVELACRLRANNHEVCVVNYFPELDYFRADLDQHDIPVFDVNKRHRFSLAPVIGIRRVVREMSIQGVISFMDSPNIYSILATMFLGDVRVVVSERSMFLGESIPFIKRIAYRLYTFADQITVNSQAQFDLIVRLFPRLSNKTVVVRNATDLKKFFPMGRGAESGAPLKLLAVANLHRYKNARNLIKAVSFIQEQEIKISVSWVGRLDDDDHMRQYKLECDQLIKSLGIAKCWNWQGPREDVQVLMNNSDAIIHPSFVEGLSNVVCEALSCGKMVLAGRMSDHPYLLQNGRGLLFEPSEPKSIALAILQFSKIDAKTRLEYEEQAREFAEHEFSSKKFVNAYEEALARP
jgi:glycosyltransferase involved in cell wall biosynthesis